MTDITTAPAAADARQIYSLKEPSALMKRRRAAEARFKAYGIGAIAISVLFLLILLFTILSNGLSSFRQTFITFPVSISQEEFEAAEASLLKTGAYRKMMQQDLEAALADAGVTPSIPIGDVMKMISGEAPSTLRQDLLANPEIIGGDGVSYAFLANGRIDGYYKGRVTMESAEIDGNVSPEQLQLADKLKEAGILKTTFNWGFFTNADASVTTARGCGCRGRDPRVDLHDADRVLPRAADRGCRLDLSGGVRAEEPLDRPDRGEHQRTLPRFPPSCSVSWAWRSSSTSPVCRNRRPSSAVWC